ncbi:MAG: hypothetical protein H0W62_06675 [Chitinophagales bacterium]|nr:hypothetical protein [Chitinophagales bacterium]
MTLQDWIGFAGVGIVLVAYLLNLLGKLSQNSISYLVMNVIGAALTCYASMLIHYIPFIILEGIWTIASLISLMKILYKKDPVSST